MKRQASPSESGRERKRQDPVSCSLCRSKKLKCSRVQPCSNCASRGIQCDYSPPRSNHVASSERTTSNDHVIADVLARLQRLERVVLDTTQNSSPNTWSDFSQPRHPTSAAKVTNAGEYSSQNVDHDQAFVSVESITTRDDAVNLAHADRFTYGFKPASEVIANVGIFQDGCLHGGISLSRHVMLPQEHETLGLLEEYIQSTGTVYHVLHFPTTRKLIKDTYKQLYQRKQVNSAHIALLLAVVSTGAYFWSPARASPSMFENLEKAAQASTMWRKWGLDVLENNRRTIYGSIEDIQATILITHLITNIEGFSARARCLYVIALNMGRDLSLHIMDSPRYRKRDEPSDYITLETKRRIWWYIASSDWLMCNIPGPQEGSYYVQPNQMCVNMPLNIDDDDLLADVEPVAKPISVPTGMSYFIYRSMASEFARMVVDAQPPLSSESNLIAPNDFIMLEAKIDSAADTLPSYFRFDQANDPYVVSMHTARPELSMQRAVINLGINLARLRLYRPHLFRHGIQPPYDRSRSACLRAARDVIRIRQSMEFIHNFYAFSRTRITFIVHHVFMAVLVLALDLCFNEFSGEETKGHRRKEVREACRLLEDTREISGVAARYLKPLFEILKKHRINLQDSSDLARSGGGGGATAESGKRSGNNAAVSQQQQKQGRGGAGNITNSAVRDTNISTRPNTNENYNGIVISGNASATTTTTTTVQQSPNHDIPDDWTNNMLWEGTLDFTSFETAPDWEQLFADLDSTYTF